MSSCRHSRFESECDSNAFRYRLLLLTQVLTATLRSLPHTMATSLWQVGLPPMLEGSLRVSACLSDCWAGSCRTLTAIDTRAPHLVKPRQRNPAAISPGVQSVVQVVIPLPLCHRLTRNVAANISQMSAAIFVITVITCSCPSCMLTRG